MDLPKYIIIIIIIKSQVDKKGVFLTSDNTGIAPVSYTHLDVYKRQVHGSYDCSQKEK